MGLLDLVSKCMCISPKVGENSSTDEGGPLSLNPLDTAVIFIEYQNEFTTEGGALHDDVKECMEDTGMIENSKKVMDAARDSGALIIHVPIIFEKGHLEISKKPYGILAGIKEGELFKADTWGAEICDAMKPSKTDIVIKGKNGLCGFKTTNLNFILRQGGVKNVVLGGFLTNCCIESTMRNAYELGYQVYTMEDCCAATSVGGHKAAFEHTFGMFSVPTKSSDIIDALSLDK
jgi:nicotinamidase-related amidase